MSTQDTHPKKFDRRVLAGKRARSQARKASKQTPSKAAASEKDSKVTKSEMNLRQLLPESALKRSSNSGDLPSGPMKKKVKKDGKTFTKWVTVPASKQEAVAELQKKDSIIKGLSTKKSNIHLKLDQSERDIEVLEFLTSNMWTMLAVEGHMGTVDGLARELFMRIRPHIEYSDLWSISDFMNEVCGVDVEDLENFYQNSLVDGDDV